MILGLLITHLLAFVRFGLTETSKEAVLWGVVCGGMVAGLFSYFSIRWKIQNNE